MQIITFTRHWKVHGGKDQLKVFRSGGKCVPGYLQKTQPACCRSAAETSGRASWRSGEGSQMTQGLRSSGKKCRIGIWSSVLELFVRIGRAAEQQMAGDMRRGFGELRAKRAWNPGSPWHSGEHIPILTSSLAVYRVDIWISGDAKQDGGQSKIRGLIIWPTLWSFWQEGRLKG